MLFSELYKIMVIKVTFVGLRVDDSPNRPLLDQPLGATAHAALLYDRGVAASARYDLTLKKGNNGSGHGSEQIEPTLYPSEQTGL